MFKEYILIVFDKQGEIFNIYETKNPTKDKETFLYVNQHNYFCEKFKPFSFEVIEETKEIKAIISFYKNNIKEIIKKRKEG